tara:strand:- start:206 stop:631 length:426 start_codon:yes stop_codon:yes gene_type:complete
LDLVGAKELLQDLDQVVLLMVEILCLTVIEQVVAAVVDPLYQHNQQELLVQMVDLELPEVLDLVVDQEEITPKVVAQDHLLEVLMVALEVTTLVVEAVVPMMMEPPHQLTQMMVLPVVMEKHFLHIPDLYLHQCPVHGKVR